MGKLNNLQPSDVFGYFEEICGIPHGSGNTKMISDYLVNFARQHGLEYYQDDSNNVIIIKEASIGYENAAPLIIQGHMDMVCEKALDCDIDFEKDGLRLVVSGDYVYADGTTLGGDDGIAVAYGLALLSDDDQEHPRLEFVVTVDEEIGMLGASAIDLSVIKGRKLLNIDSEEEGYFLASCAGGITAHCDIPVEYEKMEAVEYEVTVSGLIGGHSGVEIDKGRGNSNIIMGRLFNYIAKDVKYTIGNVNGGLKDNAIPNNTRATLYVAADACVRLEKSLLEFNSIIRNEYRTSDPNVITTFNKNAEAEYTTMTDDSTNKVRVMLLHTPNGIQNMSMEVENLVETSLNLGILTTNDNTVSCSYSVRSSVKTAKEALVDKLISLTELLGGKFSSSGDYPAWEYKRDSQLRELVISVYEEQYGSQPQIEAIHAGVECGIFSGKLDGLDCISFGPDIYDIHTAKERISIASVDRTWKLLKEIVRRSR